MTLTFTNSEVNTTWQYVNSNDSTTYSLDATRENSLKSNAGTNSIS